MAGKKTSTSEGTAKAKINKAKLVRDYDAEHPNARPKDVVEALAALGVKVTSNYVATVRYHASGKSKKKGNSDVTFDDVLAISPIVTELGGIEKVQASLSVSQRIATHCDGDLAKAEAIVKKFGEFSESLKQKAPAEG